MAERPESCPDCARDPDPPLDRRRFLVAAGAAAASLPLWATPRAAAAPTPKSAAETAVKALYDTLTPDQKKAVCFAWDHQDPKRGLLRTHVSNNWHIVPQTIRSDFYTKKQQLIIHDIFKGLLNPEWHARFERQAFDDNGKQPWGTHQNIAIFGEPGTDKFELVISGRHQTLRADGNTGAHVAFGGPVFYGHAAQGANEKPDHPGNVFWPQALAANKIYQMLNGKQQKEALVAERPAEDEVAFRGSRGGFPGLPYAELSRDQQAELQKVLMMLIEPFRVEDRDEVQACLKAQGGLEKCSLAFYKDGDIGDDGVWDNWRIEGPAFVWYFRGEPHVHVWVNIADDPSVPLNAKG